MIYRETKRERGLGFFFLFCLSLKHVGKFGEVVGACGETVGRKSKVTVGDGLASQRQSARGGGDRDQA